MAIEASKYEAEEDKKRRERGVRSADNDDDLVKAIRLSKEEEELRRRELEDQNTASLFDETPAPTQPQSTGWNQGYQQQGAVDWFGNPLTQQPQTTGFLNNQYALQPQQTGFQNGYTNGIGAQPTGYAQQPTGFDQFAQQQQQQQPQQQATYLQQQNTLQPQQTAFNSNPYGQQQSSDIFGQQSPQPSFPQAGSHNPWATNASQQTAPLQPLMTGSNNPFAQGFGQARPEPQKTQTTPSLNTLYEQQPTNQFSQLNQPNPIASFQSPQQQHQQQKPQNTQHARLNALLASGEGQDTFGNVGDLRIPAQHTAPGTFVNSAGGGIDRLRAAQTGNNPFFQQQSTGMGPAHGGFGQQIPAQTGAVGGFGGAFGQHTNNSFGTRPAGQQQQAGSLIDL